MLLKERKLIRYSYYFAVETIKFNDFLFGKKIFQDYHLEFYVVALFRYPVTTWKLYEKVNCQWTLTQTERKIEINRIKNKKVVLVYKLVCISCILYTIYLIHNNNKYITPFHQFQH